MNKKEWKNQYSAARMLLRARFPEGYYKDSEDARKIVWDITYKSVMNMHSSIPYAVFTWNDYYFYPVTDSISMKINLGRFNRKNPIRVNKQKWKDVFPIK